MSLFGLRPEEPAAIRIREAATRGTLSHALLLTGSGDRMSAACFAAAALECTGGESRPCGVCPACRKVLAGIHPDVITVRDPDHKNIAVDVVRAIRADAYIRPNEGRRKVYVFPDCALLTEQDQNVLLKVVEEGPPYAAFLFCAENAAVVLQTLRSRCVELKLHPAAEVCNPDAAQTFPIELFQTPLANSRGCLIGRPAAVFCLAQSNTVWLQKLRGRWCRLPQECFYFPLQQRWTALTRAKAGCLPESGPDVRPPGCSLCARLTFYRFPNHFRWAQWPCRNS